MFRGLEIFNFKNKARKVIMPAGHFILIDTINQPIINALE